MHKPIIPSEQHDDEEGGSGSEGDEFAAAQVCAECSMCSITTVVHYCLTSAMLYFVAMMYASIVKHTHCMLNSTHWA